MLLEKAAARLKPQRSKKKEEVKGSAPNLSPWGLGWKQPCIRCGAEMPGVSGLKAAVCGICGWKDDCC
jgi:hypothetical protein